MKDETLHACIDACVSCAIECELCATECLHEKNVKEMARPLFADLRPK